ncbi:MAG: hypothetical protein M9892_04465 [Bacteroidetes bacterium]|nr:hypothetical protein [Bacteroidota bacterium]
MNKPTLTPEQAIEQVCALTSMTHEQYHNHVLTLGTSHCRKLIHQHLGVIAHGVLEVIVEDIVSELITNHRYGWWAYFQNVCYSRNKRLVEICGHLSDRTEKSFVMRIWINQLQHDRINTYPSHLGYNRMLAAVFNNLFVQKSISPQNHDTN